MESTRWMTEGQGLRPRRPLFRITHNKVISDCVILLIGGHAATFMSALFYKISPKWSIEKADWFLCPGFKMDMAHEWWLKLSGDYLLNVMTYYVMAKIAAKFSDSLFLICVILFGYHIVDLFMFFWDFNGQFYIYIDLLWTAIMLIKYAIVPVNKEKLGRIKSLF